MISEDEYLERVVAGIQAATNDKSEIKWNDIINGRQFDCTVRFKNGTLNYFVIFEVKNKSRKSSASDIEAFVTKGRDQNANKLVFVTVAGFQSGAIEVARRHGVDLYRIFYDDKDISLPRHQGVINIINENYIGEEKTPQLHIGEETHINNITSITLKYMDGSKATMPKEASQMTYYCSKSKFKNGQSIEDIIHTEVDHLYDINAINKKNINIKPPMRISPPDEYFFKSGIIKSLEIDIQGILSRQLTGNIKVDPGLFTSKVVYEDILNNEVHKFEIYDLIMGSENVEVGKFYCTMHPLNYYYCSKKTSSSIQWMLIESFQNGDLIRATYTQDVIWEKNYIPISDKKTIARLKKRLSDYLNK